MEAKPQIHSFHTTKSILLKLAFYPMCGLYHHSNQPRRKRTYIAKHTVASSQESSTQETTLEDIESNHPPLEHVNFDSQKMAKIIPTSSQIHIIPNHPKHLHKSHPIPSAQVLHHGSPKPRRAGTKRPAPRRSPPPPPGASAAARWSRCRLRLGRWGRR